MGAIAAVTAVCAGAYIFQLIVLFPSGQRSAADFLIAILLSVAGLGYIAWGAVKNRSLIVGALGASEIFLLVGVAFPLLRSLRDLSVVVALLVALAVLAAFMYSWTKVDDIRRAFFKQTGLR